MWLTLSKRIRNSALYLVMAGCLSISGIAGAFGETPPTGTEIREFSLLDTGSDVVGSADFTPEGNKDGHFKLRLNLAQKTVINAVVLRSTDDYGKDNYQGVWRTNRATTGWLLGIVQDKTVKTANDTTHESEIINPGFRKDVKEPVGEFEGDLTFDLYASDNGTIKETQYYVLEIVTPQGTVVSKPIKYKKPMITGGAATPTTPANPTSPAPTPTPVPAPVPVPTPPVPVPTTPKTPLPQGPTIHVLFKGQELHFDGAQPILKDGSTLVPFRKLFETLGFTVKWIESGNNQQAIGTKDGLTIELTMNSTTAKVNGNNVTMDVPAQNMNGNTLVPLRFVAENSGYQVSYTKDGEAATIQIEDAAIITDPVPNEEPAPDPIPEPSKEEVEPYVVKGYVRDAKGHPISGVSIYADNTLLYDSNILGVTDESGHYRIELPQITTSWRMGADLVKQYTGKNFKFHLNADVDQPLAGSTGAVRDFTWMKFDGQIYIYPFFTSSDDSLPEFQMSDLEVTLTPVGPLLDGSTGKTITKHAGPVQGGAGVDAIPIGRYKASARWLPEGHDPIPVQIKVSYIGKYAESVEFEFGEPRGISTSNYLSELEVKIP